MVMTMQNQTKPRKPIKMIATMLLPVVRTAMYASRKDKGKATTG